MTTNPRTIASAARGTVIIGSGLALGVLSAHMYGQAALNASAQKGTANASAQSAKPKVVTIKRTKHIKSDPVVVYRQNSGSTGTGYTPPSSGGSSTGGSYSSGSAPAPAAPKPAPAQQPAAKSGAS